MTHKTKWWHMHSSITPAYCCCACAHSVANSIDHMSLQLTSTACCLAVAAFSWWWLFSISHHPTLNHLLTFLISVIYTFFSQVWNTRALAYLIPATGLNLTKVWRHSVLYFEPSFELYFEPPSELYFEPPSELYFEPPSELYIEPPFEL